MAEQSEAFFCRAAVPIVAVSLARWSPTALTAAMHSANSPSTYRRASALLAGALGASHAARSGMQADYTKPITFGRAHGVDAGNWKTDDALTGILA
jgi:hypothetical protein